MPPPAVPVIPVVQSGSQQHDEEAIHLDHPQTGGSTVTKLDRQRGMLLGLAVGDALGAAVEFQAPGSFVPVTDYRRGGPHHLEPGEWTDDTSMALALADSLAEIGWDLEDQMRRYVRWWQSGEYSSNGRCFDIGNTTVAALCEFQRSGDPRRSGPRDSRQSGNGSIMRLAPVAIRYANMYPQEVPDLAERAIQSSLPTHASPQCRSSCAYMALVLAALANGTPREVVLDPGWSALTELRNMMELHPEVEEVIGGSFRQKSPPQIRGSGYVVASMEAALWAFHSAQSSPRPY